MARLRRINCSEPGIGRRRCGGGFIYLDSERRRVSSAELVNRCRQLAIPPAWTDVWICPDPFGHIQATGIDAEGRKQYLYHERWTIRATSRKFDSVLDFARQLPAARRTLRDDLANEGMPREKCLALAVRMLDVSPIRIGSEQYADQNGTYGVATLLRQHVSVEGISGLRLRFPGKGSQDWDIRISVKEIRRAAEPLLRRRSGPGDFLAWRDGRRWRDLRSEDVNEYIKTITGPDWSAKDFRTWNATVLAAIALSKMTPPETRSGADRAVREVIGQVAEAIGNTPAVCRDSYVDPRVLDRFRDGTTLNRNLPARLNLGYRARNRLDRAVLRLTGNG